MTKDEIKNVNLSCGVRYCNECEYYLRCEECVYNKKDIYKLLVYERKEAVKDIIAKIEELADDEIKKNSACEIYFDKVLDLLDEEIGGKINE